MKEYENGILNTYVENSLTWNHSWRRRNSTTQPPVPWTILLPWEIIRINSQPRLHILPVMPLEIQSSALPATSLVKTTSASDVHERSCCFSARLFDIAHPRVSPNSKPLLVFSDLRHHKQFLLWQNINHISGIPNSQRAASFSSLLVTRVKTVRVICLFLLFAQ